MIQQDTQILDVWCWPSTPQHDMWTQGYGSATAHHGEILQGVFEGIDGGLHRGLVTLPCSIFRSEATFVPDPNGPLIIDPPGKCKARQAVELTLRHYGKTMWGGRLILRSNIPQCWGLGSSTCDVTAAIRAVADAFTTKLAPTTIAELAVKVEAASDSIMFEDRSVLFAHRDGIVIEELGGPLPPLEVVGFNTDPTGEGIDTLSFSPARYSWWEVEAFRPMIGLLRRAISTQDPRLVGQVALASARMNQRHLPKPQFDRLERLVEMTQAVSLQVAHSGTVAGILFDPSDSDKCEKIQQAQAVIAELGFGAAWHFQTGNI